MTDYILKHRRDIDRAALSDMMASDDGTPKLEINAYYSKDGRQRGIKISIYRTLETAFGSSYDLMNRHNGQVHIADLPRKPSPKLAAVWEARIAAQLDAIAVIAMESDAPDWSKIKTVFASESV